MTYEQIEKVNAEIKTIDVKGKNYAMVASRIQGFRKLCPNGSIATEIVDMRDGVVTMRATVRDEEGHILGTGFAQEKESSSYINKTSYIENCETSAVGRALGMLGIGSEEQMTSAEELVNAITNQGRKTDEQKQLEQQTIGTAKMSSLTQFAERVGVPMDKILESYGLKSIGEMTEHQYAECVRRLQKTEKENKDARKAS